MKKVYITTPIFYVNDSPHIGHAYTSIICDTFFKFYKLNGIDVLFTTGTDEHGLKVEKAAQNSGMTAKKFVDKVSQNFKKLTEYINLSNTDFIRTTEERHKKAAIYFWEKLCDKKQIYLSKYEGWYSIKDESFYQEKELKQKGSDFFTSDGEKVDWVEEESFFFKLSEWQNKLLKYYDENPDFIKPISRRNEVISFVKNGLKDLSVSRTSFTWGIKVKGSENHIMYVWIDALVNYLTSLGYPNLDEDNYNYWKNCVHFIGKDILKFHVVYWPAMLMALDLPLPKTIFAHGWWTNEGMKISKSLGNTIDPYEIINNYGLDQFRFFLLREVTLGQDGDFSEQGFKLRVNAELSNNLGNLVQRTLKFLKKNFDNKVPYELSEVDLKLFPLKKCYTIFKKVNTSFLNFEINKALDEIFNFISNLNKFMDESAPWNSIKTDKLKTSKDITLIIEGFRIIGIILQPFLPLASNKLLNILNIDKEERKFVNLNPEFQIRKGQIINDSEVLFPRYE